MRTEMSRWDESRWQIRKVGKPDSGNVKEVCGADTTPSPSTPDGIDRSGLSADQRCALGKESACSLHPSACRVDIAIWDEEIGLKNGLIHFSAESLH